MANALVSRWFSEDSVQSKPALMEFWQQQLMKVDNHSYDLLCAWLGNTDLTKKHGIKNVKTQLICGEKDVATTPELMNNLASLMHIDSTIQLDHVGHVPSVESPKALADILKSFISS
ncbi:alpha/beta fold hydrolase [Marinomonas ushuaiensis]|uniref:alpha/beta fold hydrolase n=1 Tax=Marinomonas ushuaiensis TaxID=263818 RepID=UPI0004B7456C|nr:alpha/beta hydrolase [Marinomonas ushuaiensis]